MGLSTTADVHRLAAIHSRPETNHQRLGSEKTPTTPLISYFYGIRIYLYFSDHPPGHIHVRYGDEMAVVAIDTGDILAGWLPGRAARLVEEWRRTNVDALRVAWQRAQAHENPGTIDPLD
jgi:hypothetical protein